MSEEVPRTTESPNKVIEQTRPLRTPDGLPRKATIMLAPHNRDPSRIYVYGANTNITLINQLPYDIDRKPYWLVYVTHWNNFAAYGDEKNSNNAYELACYVEAPKCVIEEDFERMSKVLNDLVSAYLESRKAPINDLRVSHLIFRTSTAAPIYEKCFQKALKTPKIRVWESL